MHRSDAKFTRGLTDVWSAVVLAVFIGMVMTLAVRVAATGDQGVSMTISSTGPAARLNPL